MPVPPPSLLPTVEPTAPGRLAAETDAGVVHLRDDIDDRDPAELAELVAELRRRGTPLVVTVRHLRHPHHERPDEHDRRLDVLVPAADVVVTLTPGAAAQIEERWGRPARVIPHPHVVPLDRMAARGAVRSRRPGGEFRVGLHLRSLRPSMDPMAILPCLVETVAALRGAVLQVNGHRDALVPGGHRVDPRLSCYLRSSAERGLVDLRVHDPLPDAQLWDHIEELDVSVLPDHFGTHSRWLEACRDLGTTVIAPTCGFHAQQGPVLSYLHDEARFVPESLVDAVRGAYEERPDLSCSVAERREQQATVTRLHEHLYRDLVGHPPRHAAGG
ncbi:glycosyltransferase family 1 protein [Nocardioides sp. Root190]|uniref:glycosyltransferase family 1 protein n=1 Tax=Nocardioides sp. Root190 TaxID=1736488 RepID=UPI0012F9BD6D|nr:glycosyltransferase family 1 protein [Nocardioides sp. Root190]